MSTENPYQNLGLLLPVIDRASLLFREELVRVAAHGGSLTLEQYHRYLSFQYHLTKGVQRAFMKCVGHPDLSGRRSLREFLFRFAMQEEPHYKVAEIDLKRLGLEPLPCTLDVALWWAWFDQIVETRPFVRIGAATILENLGSRSQDVARGLLRASFLNRSNTRFVEIHFHEHLPHGSEILDALNACAPSKERMDDLIEGANCGALMYIRMVRWALVVPDDAVNRLCSVVRTQRHELGEYRDLDALTDWQ